jgi:hypothetical protein
LIVAGDHLIAVDMSVIRATSLSGYPRVVAELGGHPAELLRGAGVRPQDVGTHDVLKVSRNCGMIAWPNRRQIVWPRTPSRCWR